jgi:hypothetical protein
MRGARAIAILALLSLGACRTRLLDEFDLVDGGPARDFSMSPVPPDFAVFNEDAACIPEPPVMGNCPCGSDGLCRPPTGRISVQTQTPGGALQIEVMDDNGCRKTVVANDHPIGVPRWAPDRERLAYVTGTNGSTLHVIRVAASGAVPCRNTIPLSNLQVTEVAWEDDDHIWLFGAGKIVEWTLASGQVQIQPLPGAARFDAIGDGPLVVVTDTCGPMCTSRLDERAAVLGTGNFLQLVTQAKKTIGPVRISPDGQLAVFELQGSTLVPLDGMPPTSFGQEGDRSPAFALRGQAVVFATDDGSLKYHFLDGSSPDLTIPSDWKFVYSPDWSPGPKSCNTTMTCL